MPQETSPRMPSQIFDIKIFATPAKALRSRFVGAFLLFNWGVMGWFTIRAPSLGWAALTLPLGLLGFVGGFSQIRAARRAREEPLAKWNETVFGLRAYTQSRSVELPWQRMVLTEGSKPSNAARPKGDNIEVTISDSRIFFLGWPEAAKEGDDRRGVDDVAPRNILDLSLFEKQDQQRIVDTLRREIKRAN